MTECPYCKINDPISDIVYRNAECYGSRTFNITCIKCGGAIYIKLQRNVQCIKIEKTYFKQGDFGEIPTKTIKDK